MGKPKNPYVIGNSVGDSPAFVGRDDVLREVLNVVRHDNQNAIVLFGQRRIGKTSVLRELKARLPKEGDFLPVFFDLQDKSRWPLDRVLRELAHKIIDSVPNGNSDLGNDPEKTFRNEWLPNIIKTLPAKKSLVLLFDEFDVMAISDEVEQANAVFFPYLRSLLDDIKPQHLNFVFAIGRNIKDLNNVALSFFKATVTKRVSLLNHEDTAKLVRLSETNNTLKWSEGAIKKVRQETNGHPHLTQCLCYCIWNTAYDNESDKLPEITSEKVDAAIPNALEIGESAFEWLWDGLGPAERVVASALAGAGAKPMTGTQLKELLKESGVQIMFKELQKAPHLLQEWDLIEPTEKEAYRFRVELLRRWIADNKPLHQVQEDLDRLDPEANELYKAAQRFYTSRRLDAAIESLRQVISINYHHVGAYQLLADAFLAKNQLSDAREILEQLYDYNPVAARNPLVDVLLSLAKSSDDKREQRKIYERVLELEPEQSKAKRILLGIKNMPIDKKVLRSQFEERLNEIVEEDNWIDAVFVLDLPNGFISHGSSTKEGAYPDLVEKLKVGGSGANIAKIISVRTKKELEIFGQKCDRGTLDSIIFKFANGILNMYIHTPKTIPFAIGFVSADSGGLGAMLAYCEDYVAEIRELLDKLYG